jgi:hypothetical protein
VLILNLGFSNGQVGTAQINLRLHAQPEVEVTPLTDSSRNAADFFAQLNRKSDLNVDGWTVAREQYRNPSPYPEVLSLRASKTQAWTMSFGISTEYPVAGPALQPDSIAQRPEQVVGLAAISEVWVQRSKKTEFLSLGSVTGQSSASTPASTPASAKDDVEVKIAPGESVVIDWKLKPVAGQKDCPVPGAWSEHVKWFAQDPSLCDGSIIHICMLDHVLTLHHYLLSGRVKGIFGRKVQVRVDVDALDSNSTSQTLIEEAAVHDDVVGAMPGGETSCNGNLILGS